MNNINEYDKNCTAYCGVFCEACMIFIATKNNPERLKELSVLMNIPEDDLKCHGCKSDKVCTFCKECEIAECASTQNLEFCSECSDFPCKMIKDHQSNPDFANCEDLWEDFDSIKDNGYAKWLDDTREKFSCSNCNTINSAYDLKCWKCGKEPSNEYVMKHKERIINSKEYKDKFL